MNPIRIHFGAGITLLLLSVIACQPVIAIGWRELLFVAILTALLIGPPVYRFFRRHEDARRQKEK